MNASVSLRIGQVTMLALLSAGTSPAPAQVTYGIDTHHSTVIFRVKHLKVSYFYGRFRKISGEFKFDRENPENSSINVSVKVESIKTDHGDRDQELLSHKMFDLVKYPTIDFVSREFKKIQKDHYEVTGDMTLHGVTRSITVPVEHVGEGRSGMGIRSGLHSIFTIKRSDYGMTWFPEALGDEVQLIVSLEGVRKLKG